MSNDKAPEIPKVLNQAGTPKPRIENSSDQQHASTFADSIRRVTGSAAQAVLRMHLPMSPDIARKFFPHPSEQDRSATIDAAVKSGHLDSTQGERLKKKLTQPQEQT